ncbi:hypothetical protein WJX84_000603 [Apatococcus fuscideae]|uniref:Elongator complex protein 4 n=1 Tax=Apatococcus fuscideae TaxID=2026836 RepID=A0AAW1TA38_9CHLO
MASQGSWPGMHSRTLISTGLADLDGVLGGGLPLGSVLLILQDSWTPHASTLLKYFAAEGVACQQSIFWAAPPGAAPPNEPGASPLMPPLPKQVAAQSSRAEKEQQAETDAAEGDDGLRIAWQYRRLLKKQGRDSAAAVPFAGPARASSGASAFRRSKLPGASTARALALDLDMPSRPIGSSSVGLDSSDSEALALRVSSQTGVSAGSLSLAHGTSDAGAEALAARLRNQETLPHSHAGPALKRPTYDLTQTMPRDQMAAAHVEYRELSGPAALRSLVAAATAAIHQPQAATTKQAPPAPSSHQRLAESLPPQHLAVPLRLPPDQLAASPSRLLSTDAQVGIVRVVVESIGSPAWDLEASAPASAAASAAGLGLPSASRSLVHSVMALKQLVRRGKSAAMISFPAETYTPSVAMRLQHLCDAVIALEAVAEDSSIVKLAPDPSSCVALLHVRKLPGLNAFARPSPGVPLYLVRHKRRRLAIEAVEVDPDAEAALAAAPGAVPGSSAAALACGGPAGAPKAMDF